VLQLENTFRQPFRFLLGKLEKIALVEPGPEAREVEYGAFPVFRVIPCDVGADMSEFVEIGEMRHPQPSGNTKARTPARASERGQFRTASRKRK